MTLRDAARKHVGEFTVVYPDGSRICDLCATWEVDWPGDDCATCAMRVALAEPEPGYMSEARRRLIDEVAGCPESHANNIAARNRDPFTECQSCLRAITRFTKVVETAVLARSTPPPEGDR